MQSKSPRRGDRTSQSGAPATDAATPPDLAALLSALATAREQPSRHYTDAVLRDLHARLRRRLQPSDPLREAMDSEDLAQGTLLDLIHALPEFRGSTWPAFLGFASALAERRKVDEARRLAVRRRRRASDVAIDELSGRGAAPNEVVAGKEQRAAIQRAIRALPADHRVVLEARMNGKSHDELATQLGITSAAARKRLSRALQALRGSLPR